MTEVWEESQRGRGKGKEPGKQAEVVGSYIASYLHTYTLLHSLPNAHFPHRAGGGNNLRPWLVLDILLRVATQKV